MGLYEDNLKEWGRQISELRIERTKQYVCMVLDELFEEIKHGDQEHQDWLKNKIEDFKQRLTL